MQYVPWDELNGRPSIIVDGYPAEGTVLTLSHWKGSGSPEELADDLSTQIAFRYLDRPDLHVDAEAVSNNHFDEDGLSGIYAVLNPSDALARREKLIQVASAGDFGVFQDRDAARVAFALMTFADEDRSPLKVFDRPYPQQSAALYSETLGLLPEMVDAPDRFRGLWEVEDAWLERDLKRVDAGDITIEERPEIDLAIVTLPEDTEAPFDTETTLLGAHQGAIHNRTRLNRTLLLRGNRYSVQYRYETWVQYVSVPTMPRIDLSPLADELTARETGDVRWTFDGVDNLTPSLRTKVDSSLSPGEFVDAVTRYLGRAAAL